MKTIHRIMGTILAIVLVVQLAPFPTYASSGDLSGSCGDKAVWDYYASSSTLEISGTGDMDDYFTLSNQTPWSSVQGNICHVVVNDGITSIGSYAFFEADSLTSVSIPGSVASIHTAAFAWCANLDSLSLSEGLKTISSSAFDNCNSLAAVDIPDSVQTIDTHAFSGSGLCDIVIPAEVCEIDDSAFQDCPSLSAITVDEGNNSYSSDASGVLYNKEKTVLIQFPVGSDLPSYDIPSGVTTIGEFAFSNCWLEQIFLPDSITGMGCGAFENSLLLTSMEIPSKVTALSRELFMGCGKLESLTLYNSLSTIAVAAVDGCDSLTDVYFNGSFDEWNQILVFDNNDPLMSITLHTSDPSPFHNLQGMGNFIRSATYYDEKFSDVPTNSWYYDSVAAVYEYGLMVGNSDSTFNPGGNVTIAETLTVAARLHSIYYTREDDFAQGKPWYQAYVDYAKDNGITASDYSNYNKPATRAEYAAILANALPDGALPAINTVEDDAIPDVKISDSYGEAVYKLYRAGIFIGCDSKGTFTPNSYIQRSEVAAAVSRMANADLRQSTTLKNIIVKASDSAYAIADPSTLEGQAQLERVAEGIADAWTDDNGTPSDKTDDMYNIVISSTDPLYQDIQDGLIEESDTLFFPQCEYFAVDMALVYQYHDDSYADWMNYSSSSYEVLHTRYADYSDLLKEGEELSYSSASFDANDPIAFAWAPGSGAAEDTFSTQAASQDTSEKTAEAKFSVVKPGFQTQNLNADHLLSYDLTGSNKYAGLKLDDTVIYDADGKSSTTADQITLSGQIMMENININSAFHEDFHWSDPLPKQAMLKLSYEMDNDFKVSLGGEIANISDAMDDMKAAARKHFNTQGHNNVRHLPLGIDMYGVDMSNSIIIGAIGFNLSPDVSPKLGIKSIRSQSIYYGVVPSVVVLFTLDFDGSVTATVVGEYTYHSYVEKGFNVQKDDFDGGDGTVSSNQGQRNISLPLDRQLNIYDVEAKSGLELGKKPVSKFTLTADAKAELDVYASVGLGLMVAGIIPAEVKGSVGPELSAEVHGKVECASDTGFSAEGSIKLSGAIAVFASANVRMNAERNGKELFNLSKSWESKHTKLLDLSVEIKGAPKQLTEADLKALLTNATSNSIVSWVYDDFDGDGTKEAYALVRSSASGSDNAVWYVSSAGAKLVMNAGYANWYLGTPLIAGNHKFMVLIQYEPMPTWYYANYFLFTANNGESYQPTISGGEGFFGNNNQSDYNFLGTSQSSYGESVINTFYSCHWRAYGADPKGRVPWDHIVYYDFDEDSMQFIAR